MDLRALSKLESLQLYGNPLEFLPELSPCTNLRHLSLANVRIAADDAFTHWDVDVTATSYISRGNKLAQLFALIFRRSSCQQPLLAGALGQFCMALWAQVHLSFMCPNTAAWPFCLQRSLRHIHACLAMWHPSGAYASAQQSMQNAHNFE